MKMKKISRNSMKLSARILNSEFMKTLIIEQSLHNFLDTTHQSLLNHILHWRITYQEWKKDKKIFTLSQVRLKKLLPLLLLLKLWWREDMKFFIWLTQLMNMLFNNLRNSMERNLKTAQKKDWNLNKQRMKRSHSKKRKQPLNPFANILRKSLGIKLKRLLLVHVLMNLHVF